MFSTTEKLVIFALAILGLVFLISLTIGSESELSKCEAHNGRMVFARFNLILIGSPPVVHWIPIYECRKSSK